MSCILCGSDDLAVFLDLGSTALANKFLLREDLSKASETHYPLRVGFCRDCSHVQLADPVDPAAMFEDYLYISSASDTLKQHLHGLAATIAAARNLKPDDLVVDVGCNDGTLLEGIGLASPARRLGVDPASNLRSFSEQKGIEVKNVFFGPETAAQIRASHGRASVLTMTNTFPHIPDLPGLMTAIDSLLEDDGVFVLEAHYLGDLLDMVAFDTIYHEHVSYWALGPAQQLFERFGFTVFDVERLPIHHGQVRLWGARKGREPVSPAVAALEREEVDRGLRAEATFHEFAAGIGQLKQDLTERIGEVRRSGGSVVGYGAPAKGSTLLSYFGLGPEDLDYIVDRSPLKQGRLTPGTHVPIVPVERLLEDQPDLVVLLAWNFADEIMAQQEEYRRRGGRFVVPVPTVREI